MEGHSIGRLSEEKWELVVVYQSCDLSVCRRMILGKRTSAPDQVISCMMATRSYVSMRRWSRVWGVLRGGGGEVANC